jgi:membrane-bound metal-dependent hydrolase YbcI (DUF457 family)
MADIKFNVQRGFWHVVVQLVICYAATAAYILYPTRDNRGACVALGLLFGLFSGVVGLWIGIRLKQPRYFGVFLLALFPVIYWSRFLYVFSTK